MYVLVRKNFHLQMGEQGQGGPPKYARGFADILSRFLVLYFTFTVLYAYICKFLDILLAAEAI